MKVITQIIVSALQISMIKLTYIPQLEIATLWSIEWGENLMLFVKWDSDTVPPPIGGDLHLSDKISTAPPIDPKSPPIWFL